VDDPLTIGYMTLGTGAASHPRCLYVVAHHAATAATGGHVAGIGVGLGDLLGPIDVTTQSGPSKFKVIDTNGH